MYRFEVESRRDMAPFECLTISWNEGDIRWALQGARFSDLADPIYEPLVDFNLIDDDPAAPFDEDND